MRQIYWFLLEIVLAPLMGIFLENQFSIFQRLIRVYSKLLNKKSKAELTLWIESDKEFQILKEEIKKLFEKDIEKIKKSSPFIFEVKLNTFNFSIRKHNEGIYVLSTDNLRAGIKDIKSEVRDLVFNLNKLKENLENTKIKNISLDIYLPYKWKFLRSMKVKGYSIKDYSLKYSNDRFRTHVNIDMDKINLKNVEISQLTDVVDDFTSIF